MEQATPEEVDRLLYFVSPQRKADALKYKHLAGQYACLKSYELLHQLLAEKEWILPDEQLTFEYSEHGKPALSSHPDIHFNISHCKSAIAVAAGRDPVGIDVESFRNPTAQLLKYTMNDHEADEVINSLNPEQRFTELWTRKEALFKYYGTGINHSIKDILANMPDTIRLDTTVSIEKKYALTICEGIS